MVFSDIEFVKLTRFTVRSLLQRCSSLIRSFYKRQVDENAWPPVKATNFINLALIKDNTSWRKTVQQSVDEIIGKKEKTSYSTIFSDIENADRKLILLEGRPGCGKTTLLSKISRDWSNGKVLKSKLLIFVLLRRLNSESDHSLSTLLRVACPVLSDDDVNKLTFYIEAKCGDKVVFLLDGLDEYVPHKENEKVFELIRGVYQTKSIVIVTSRPAACADFRQHSGKRIEVLGFLKSQIHGYICHYFENEAKKAQQLIAHLEQHPNLMNMAYLPLHCAMIAFLYEGDTLLPETETEFYKHFTLSTLLRSKCKKEGEIKSSLSSYVQLSEQDKRIFHIICKLAFNATVVSKQVFTSEDVQNILSDVCTKNDVGNLGLIVVDRYLMKNGLDETFTFLHLTFQEYLAAVYISELSESEQTHIIETHSGRNHLLVVWRFLCGMIDFSKEHAMNVLRTLLKSTEDTVFQLRCCYESQNSLPCNYVLTACNGKLRFTDLNLTPSDCAAIGYVVNKSDCELVSISFNNCNASTEGIIAFLQEVGSHQYSMILK